MNSDFNRNKARNLILSLVLILSLEVGSKQVVSGNVDDAHKVFVERITRGNSQKLTSFVSRPSIIRTDFKTLTPHDKLAKGTWIQTYGSKGLMKEPYVKIASTEFQPLDYSTLQPINDVVNARFQTFSLSIMGHGLKWVNTIQADGFKDNKEEMRSNYLCCEKIFGGWKVPSKEVKQLIRTWEEENGITSKEKETEDEGQGETSNKESREKESNTNTGNKETDNEKAVKASLLKKN